METDIKPDEQYSVGFGSLFQPEKTWATLAQPLKTYRTHLGVHPTCQGKRELRWDLVDTKSHPLAVTRFIGSVTASHGTSLLRETQATFIWGSDFISVRQDTSTAATKGKNIYFAGVRSPGKRLKVKVKSLSRVWLFVTPQTVTYQAPLSTWFSRQDYWSGLPFPSPGDLPVPGIEPRSPAM